MIYFIRQVGTSITKVGYTANDPAKRLGELQTGNPNALELVAWIDGEMPVERLLHALLWEHRTRGEWYDLPYDLMCAVEDCCKPADKRQPIDFTIDRRTMAIHDALMDDVHNR